MPSNNNHNGRQQKTEEIYRLYEEALRLLHQKEYEEAHSLLLEVSSFFADEPEVLARVEAYVKVCETNLAEEKAPPKTAESMFDLGVLHHNAGHYKAALDCFVKALKLANGDQDHIYYAMAASEIPLGNIDTALKNLRKSIEIREENRFVARNDPDFEPLAQNREFQALVRPQKNEG